MIRSNMTVTVTGPTDTALQAAVIGYSFL